MHEEHHIIPLTGLQLDDQLDTVLYFLRLVHPSLDKNNGYRPCVELRPINRGEQNFALTRSLLIWDLEPESIERLRVFLERHNGQPTCLFYSVFAFDNHIKTGKASKITSASALFADEIVLDFDDIDFDGYIDLVDRFEAMGIYALWVSSGHGYQAHILLNESISDKQLLKRFVYKFRAKGFNCDTACVDPARLMRLPGTYNNKCFADDAYEDERMDPPACQIVQQSGHRYALDFLYQQLDKLPTVSEDDEIEYNLCSAVTSVPGTTKKDDVVVRKAEYPYLENYDLPSAVSQILAHTPHGYRNKALGFLINFFKNHYRMSKEPLLETLRTWAREACEPEYPDELLNSDFKRLYYTYNGIGYDSALAKQFGHIDFGQLGELRKKDIMLPRKFFADFASLDAKAVRLYLGIKMLEHVEEIVTQEQLSRLLKITDRALRPTLKDLIKSSHVYMEKGNARKKIPNVYHTQRIYSVSEGFTPFSYNDIRAYVMELYDAKNRGNGELKLYLFMRWKFSAGEVYMSQENLGKHIGIARNSVSDLVYKLQDKHFLKIRKVQRAHFLESCEYTLLR